MHHARTLMALLLFIPGVISCGDTKTPPTQLKVKPATPSGGSPSSSPHSTPRAHHDIPGRHLVPPVSPVPTSDRH